jgi:hypothetical protein
MKSGKEINKKVIKTSAHPSDEIEKKIKIMDLIVKLKIN